MLFRNSRYIKAEPELVDGCLLLNERQPIGFIDDPSNQPYVAKQGDTWWMIAARFFGNLDVASPALLYWAVMEFQPGEPLQDPTIPPAPGTLIIVPSEQLMTDVILARRPKGT